MALIDTIAGRFPAGRRGEAAPGAASSPGSRLAGTAIGFVVPLVGLAAWQVLSVLGIFQPTLVPPPVEVIREVALLVEDGTLATHIGVTLARVVAGFFWGVLAATVLGVLTGHSRLARRLLDPSIQALKAVPSLAWVPLFILWFGIFETSKVTLIAVGVFFPVYLNLMSAIRQTDRRLVEVARINGLTTWQTVRCVLLPGTLPAYVTGLRGGLALGWMFVIAAELMGASEGLGFLMVDGQMTGRPALIIASLILFAVAGKITDQLLAAGAGPWLGWQDSLETMEEGRSDA